MKTLSEIKLEAKKSDYTRVAEIVRKSASLVRKVINDEREDHHNIQKTFSDMLTARERLNERESGRQERKKQRETKACLK